MDNRIKNIKAFIFDLDNTLFDRYGTLRKIMAEQFESIKGYLNAGYTLELATEHLCAMEQLYNSFGWKRLYAQLCDANFFNPDNTPTYEQCDNFLVTNFAKTAVNFDFTVPTLKKLKEAGYKLGVITNGRSALQRSKLAMLGFSDLFDSIVVSGEYAALICGDEGNKAHWKPNPEIFRYAASTLSLEPGECCYVGDNPLHDMIPSRTAGLVPVWIRSKSPWLGKNEDMPELCLDNIGGLTALIGE